jgi:predicted metalloprotease with PDZ domain
VAEDVFAALNEVAPYDWKKFFTDRLSSNAPHAPLGGIEAGGWKLVFKEEPSDYQRAAEADAGSMNMSYSIGVKVGDDGAINDVVPGSPAARAGIGPGMKIIAVNRRRYASAYLREAIRAAKGTTEAIELLIENGDFFNSHALDYHGGEQYPHLERDPEKTDVLSLILKTRSRSR